MPGFVVTVASLVNCLHQGQVRFTPRSTRVLAGGSPVVTVADVNVVALCSLAGATPPSACTRVDFTLAGSSRVFVDGQPVVLEPLGTGAGVCLAAAPQGTPVIAAVQQRAVGS
ncbi:MAG TPA: hypothetical protein VI248_17065 [Kineosporiaceae bacterium]